MAATDFHDDAAMPNHYPPQFEKLCKADETSAAFAAETANAVRQVLLSSYDKMADLYLAEMTARRDADKICAKMRKRLEADRRAMLADPLARFMLMPSDSVDGQRELTLMPEYAHLSSAMAAQKIAEARAEEKKRTAEMCDDDPGDADARKRACLKCDTERRD